MGEIADALRRAREAQLQDGRREVRAPAPISSPAPIEPAARNAAVHAVRRPPLPAARIIESLTDPDPSLVLSDDAALDASRRVALRIRMAMAARSNCRTFAVVSAVRGEGKTTVTCDLAIALASLSKEGEVALVDLDLRNPSVARRLGLDVEVGVEQFLSGDASLDELRIGIKRPCLELYPVAAPVREAHELLVSPRFGQLIRELEARHALVLIDTPAYLVASDTAMILENISSCVLLARFGVTRMRNFKQLAAAVPRAKILGQVVNDAKVPRHRYYDYYGPEGVPAGDEPEPS